MATNYSEPLPPGMTAEDLDERFAATKDAANKAWLDTMRSYTPPELHKYLDDYAEANAPSVGGGAVVTNGMPVRVVTPLGGDVPGSPGSAAVIDDRLDFVQLSTR